MDQFQYCINIETEHLEILAVFVFDVLLYKQTDHMYLLVAQSCSLDISRGGRAGKTVGTHRVFMKNNTN